EIPVSRIERAGGRLVVQYRGQIMPLVPVADALGGHLDLAAREQVSVVVHTDTVGSVGFVVDGIHDIVTESLELERISADPGLLGSAVVQGRVVDIVDAASLVAAARPGWTPGPARTEEVVA
ncbi:MAG TPA: chemotaxis protein CheW, partial [Acidimicrobiales bacterium]|nr:chemotaxis protein CheW [Acidimicrobiales bacterium]